MNLCTRVLHADGDRIFALIELHTPWLCRIERWWLKVIWKEQMTSELSGL